MIPTGKGENRGHDDCGGVSRRAPKRREIDDRRRKWLRKQHVARQVAVHELAPGVERAADGKEICKMLDLGERLGRNVSPGDAISDRLGIGATGYEVRLGHLNQRLMKELAEGDDFAPPTFLMHAFDELPGAPAFAGESAIHGPSRKGETEFVAGNRPEDVSCQSSGGSPSSTGRSTSSPTRHALPRPPASGKGVPARPNTSITVRGGPMVMCGRYWR
jgi:hypothetical protein